jgi:hypothetical protein
MRPESINVYGIGLQHSTRPTNQKMSMERKLNNKKIKRDLDSKWVSERFDTAWPEWTRRTRKSSPGGVSGRGRPGRVSRRRVRVDSPLRQAFRPSPPWIDTKFTRPKSNQFLQSFQLFTHNQIIIENKNHPKTFQYLLSFDRSMDGGLDKSPPARALTLLSMTRDPPTPSISIHFLAQGGRESLLQQFLHPHFL